MRDLRRSHCGCLWRHRFRIVLHLVEIRRHSIMQWEIHLPFLAVTTPEKSSTTLDWSFDNVIGTPVVSCPSASVVWGSIRSVRHRHYRCRRRRCRHIVSSVGVSDGAFSLPHWILSRLRSCRIYRRSTVVRPSPNFRRGHHLSADDFLGDLLRKNENRDNSDVDCKATLINNAAMQDWWIKRTAKLKRRVTRCNTVR